jgi:hypothetical protein
VATELRQHLEDGRLTMEEFTARLDEVYAARTHAQLARACRELPRLAAPPSGPPVPFRPAARRQPADLARSLAGFASPSLVSVGVWLASGHQGGFWPGWVMLASGAVALRRFSRGPGCACRARRRARLRGVVEAWPPPPDHPVPPTTP